MSDVNAKSWDLVAVAGVERSGDPMGQGVSTLNLTSTAVTVTEGQTATLTAERAGDSAGSMAVDWAVSDALTVPASGTLNWADGELGSKSALPVASLVDVTESGSLALSNARRTDGGQPAPALGVAAGTIQVTALPATWNLPATLSVQQDGNIPLRQYAANATGYTISVSGLPSGVTYDAGAESLVGGSGGAGPATATFTLTLGETAVQDTAAVALIDGVVLSHGNLFTLSGSGFGAKANNNTLGVEFQGSQHMAVRATDLENADAAGAPVNTRDGWREFTGGVYPISVDEDFNANYADFGQEVAQSGGPGQSGRWLKRVRNNDASGLRNWNLHNEDLTTDYLYASLHVSLSPGEVGKWWRQYFTDTVEGSNNIWLSANSGQLLGWHEGNNPFPELGGSGVMWSSAPQAFGTPYGEAWSRIEIHQDFVTGAMHIYVNGAPLTSPDYPGTPAEILWAGATGTRTVKHSLLGNTINENMSTGYALMYLDTDHRRIELADSQNWNSRTKSIWQAPVSWSDSAVTFRVNRGDLEPGSYWIHLVNKETSYYSAPITIVDASTALVHGQPFTVTGSGFGAKYGSAPLLWDDGTHGQPISSKYSEILPFNAPNPVGNIDYRDATYAAGFTRPIGTSVPEIRHPSRRGTKIMAGGALGTSYDTGSNIGLSRSFTVPAGPWLAFCRWWERADPAWSAGEDENFKWFDLSQGPNGPYVNPDYEYLSSGDQWPTPSNRFSTYSAIQYPDSDGRPADWALNHYFGGPSLTGWTLRELWIYGRTDANGRYWLHQDTEAGGAPNTNPLANGSGVTYRGPTDSATGGTQRTITMGGYQRRSGYSNNWRYFADCFIDLAVDENTGWFFLTNSADWATSTLRVQQPWTSYGDTAVQLICDGGHLPSGEVHLHFRRPPWVSAGHAYLGTRTLL